MITAQERIATPTIDIKTCTASDNEILSCRPRIVQAFDPTSPFGEFMQFIKGDQGGIARPPFLQDNTAIIICILVHIGATLGEMLVQ